MHCQLNQLPTQMDFRVIAYPDKISASLKRGGVVFTEIAELVSFLNRRKYWADGKEVSASDDWWYCYNNYTSGMSDVYSLEILEKPKNADIRIIGVTIFEAHKLDKIIYDNISEVQEVLLGCTDMKLYPMTMEDLLEKVIRRDPEIIDMLNNYHLIVLTNH